jgi:hypothetical protein
VSHGNVAGPSVKRPRLFTARYLAENALTSGEVVPVRISMFPPQRLLGELPYELRYSVRALNRSGT